jgi:hypothetical protein
MKEVIIGNVKIYPNVLRNFLKKSHYFFTYDDKTDTAELFVNHGAGGKELMVFKDVDYVVVKKFAEELGLKSDDDEKKPSSWHKWNPILELYDDGSEEAEDLRVMMLKLGVPHNIIEHSKFGIADSGRFYDESHDLKLLIKETADRYKEQLSTLP